jgi:hypothetical protein
VTDRRRHHRGDDGDDDGDDDGGAWHDAAPRDVLWCNAT